MKQFPKRAVLVYQTAIANVFSVESFNMADYGRDAERLIQSDFRSCEIFARGMGAAGVVVMTAACNEAGDISKRTWTEDLDEQPFSHEFRPVTCNMIGSFEEED